MTSLDLLPDEIEHDLRATLRQFLTARYDITEVAAIYDGDRSLADRLWKEISTDLGLAGLLVPASHGGADATAREASVVLEEFGRAATPAPYLTSAVVATSALLDTDSELLSALARGQATAALTVPFGAAPGSVRPETCPQLGPGGRISGRVRGVAGAIEADVLLVPVQTGSGIALRMVEAKAAEVTANCSLDMTRQLATLTLRSTASGLVTEDGGPAVDRALIAGAALLASEQVGLARWCLESTLDYLKQRSQFGRVLGSYQALKHRLADLYTSVESASAAARYAAVALAAGDPDVPVATAVAQAFCSDVAVHAAEEAVQLHGGIGMTWEHPVHLYLKRAKADQVGLGSPGEHRATLAALVDLPA